MLTGFCLKPQSTFHIGLLRRDFVWASTPPSIPHCVDSGSLAGFCLTLLEIQICTPSISQYYLGKQCPVRYSVNPIIQLSSVQFSSVAQSCPTLCNPMDCSTPGFPIHHQLLELAQTQAHRVSDAIQPFHPLLSPSLLAFNLSQPSWSFPISGLFVSEGQNIGASASVLPMNIQNWFPLALPGLMSLQFKGLSRVLSDTTIQKHQFLSVQPFLWSDSHIHT